MKWVKKSMVSVVQEFLEYLMIVSNDPVEYCLLIEDFIENQSLGE
jgi:hypothetical protein